MKVIADKSSPVWTLTLNRPEVRNCVDGETAESIARTITEFSSDDEARVLVVTGAGADAFCAGADLKNAESLLQHEFVATASPMGFARLDPGKPTIAAVNGYCVAGGLELASWCDFRVASSNARFGVLNRRWGVPLIDGGTQRLPRIMGMANALYLIETGIEVDAERALSLGFVQEVVDPGHALERAMELAKSIAAYPQTSLRGDRKAALKSHSAPLIEGIEIEMEIGSVSLSDQEMLDGLARYVSGDRPPPPR